LTIRLLGAASLVIATMGCSLAPKSKTETVTKTATNPSSGPVSQEFSTSDKLSNPVKTNLAYALWHEQQGNHVEARNAYNKVLELKTGTWWWQKNSKDIDAMLGLARLDMVSNRMDDAYQRLQKAQKVAPKNPQVAVGLGQYYMARRDLPRALEQMQAAHLLAPYDVACAYHLGLVQAKMGDLDAALSNFKEAVGAAEAEYNLGYVLYEQGNIAAAEERLQKALTLKPKLPQAQSLLISIRQQQPANPTQLAERFGSRNANETAPKILQATYTEFSSPAHGLSKVPAEDLGGSRQ
jgi:tetratricopeptide (TPR) repeat protein